MCYYIQVLERKWKDMKDQLLAYIAACEKNIVTYKEMNDSAAVLAAEGMIADFEKMLGEVVW